MSHEDSDEQCSEWLLILRKLLVDYSNLIELNWRFTPGEYTIDN